MWPGYISKRCNLHSGVPVKRSTGKTTCHKDARFGATATDKNRKGKGRAELLLEVSISGLKLLGNFFFLMFRKKKTTKAKTQWEMPRYDCIDFKSCPLNEPVIHVLR